tara:strand:+ start:1334 stop:1612 length:279 start_codon:yes stop_codon:yes gene_type:complete
MKIKAIECGACGDVVYSRTPEDYRECGCGTAATSGGQQYTKFHSPGPDSHKKVIIDVDTDVFNLYNDWKEMADAYGVISKSPQVPRMRQLSR